MCLVAAALGRSRRWPFVLAANRDEYHARPAAPAHWWAEGVFGGRDLKAGGTWLAVTRDGRFALLTNVREPERKDPSAPSRGALVPTLLTSEAPLPEALAVLTDPRLGYNGFNLLAGSTQGWWWGSNRGARARTLAPAALGLSNAQLDTPWPKLVRTRGALERWLHDDSPDVEPLFAALADRRLAEDAVLPSTGVSLEWERRLSAPFIVGENYGTRCSTVITIDAAGALRFEERSFDPRGELTGSVVETFALPRQQVSVEGAVTG